jgi:hypothetical protein
MGDDGEGPPFGELLYKLRHEGICQGGTVPEG